MAKIFYPPKKPIRGEDGQDGASPVVSEVVPSEAYPNGAIKINHSGAEYFIPKAATDVGTMYPISGTKDYTSSSTQKSILSLIYLKKDSLPQKDFIVQFSGNCVCSSQSTIKIKIQISVNNVVKVTKEMLFNKDNKFLQETATIPYSEINGDIIINVEDQAANVAFTRINSLFMKQK